MKVKFKIRNPLRIADFLDKVDLKKYFEKYTNLNDDEINQCIKTLMFCKPELIMMWSAKQFADRNFTQILAMLFSPKSLDDVFKPHSVREEYEILDEQQVTYDKNLYDFVEIEEDIGFECCLQPKKTN